MNVPKCALYMVKVNVSSAGVFNIIDRIKLLRLQAAVKNLGQRSDLLTRTR